MVESLRDRGEFDVLDAIADGRKTLLQVYAEYRSDVELSNVKVELDDMDIEPLVETWHAAIRQRHPETAAKYLAQVRRLIPAGAPFPKSRFRRKVISEHLAGLVDLRRRPTRSRQCRLPRATDTGRRCLSSAVG